MYKLAICDNCNQFLQNLNKEISIVLKEDRKSTRLNSSHL